MAVEEGMGKLGTASPLAAALFRQRGCIMRMAAAVSRRLLKLGRC